MGCGRRWVMMGEGCDAVEGAENTADKDGGGEGGAGGGDAPAGGGGGAKTGSLGPAPLFRIGVLAGTTAPTSAAVKGMDTLAVSQ